MRTPLRLLLAFVAIPVVLAAIAHAGVRRVPKPSPPASDPAACRAVPGLAPDVAPLLRARVAVNLTNALLESPAGDTVEVCLLVDTTGTVREVALPHPGSPFDDAALAAARWWLFVPAQREGRAVPARVRARIAIEVPADAEPLNPDVIVMAREAEARGDLRGAMDSWTGALARAGRLAALPDEWALRHEVIRLAIRQVEPPVVPAAAVSRARQMHNLMTRNMARQDNADFAKALDEVLLTAPWYADAYRWRASARAASGAAVDAARDVLCYRLAARDSAGRALAERALVALANADTLSAMAMLKN
ncbi:MAG: energy transducer TonB [Candidatus Eisenbacteria bacterium]